VWQHRLTLYMQTAVLLFSYQGLKLKGSKTQFWALPVISTACW